MGGVPGLIVDNAMGAAWKPTYGQIHRDLSPLNAAMPTPQYAAAPPASNPVIQTALNPATPMPLTPAVSMPLNSASPGSESLSHTY